MGSFVRGNVTSTLKGGDTNTTSFIDKDKEALLNIKANLVDIHNILRGWGDEEEKKDCCKWYGVRCNNRDGRVVGLDLSSSSKRLSVESYTKVFGFDRSLSGLRHLDISSANLSGPIPIQLATLSNLLHLDLSRNFLTGSIPNSFGNSSSLVELNLSENLLNGSLPNFVGCSSLANLSLGHNSFNGSIPDFTQCQFLRKIDLSSNRLNGDLPNSVGRISNLEYLDVSSNSLKGVISDVHFQNLTKLTYLDMSFNSFAFRLSSIVSIPFRLQTIKLQFCKLGHRFPMWLQNKSYITHLDISNAGISDSVPAWFWDDLSIRLRFLNISSNELRGTLPNMTATFYRYPGMDLSNNRLEGRVTKMPSELAALNLSGNRFSGTLDFLCQIDRYLTFLDVSNNSFSGTLPDCWLIFQKKLVVLSLSNNNLSGEIPSSLGFLSQLEALYMGRNSFVGELPMSLSNCTKLRFADFGENLLSSNIPAWIGERLSELYVLVLRSNRFYGSLPSEICLLKQLQFLDLSKNGLSGNIPRCFGNLTAMSKKGVRVNITNHSYSSYVATFLPDDEGFGFRKGPYLSYGALVREQVPCSQQGEGYYDCQSYKEIDDAWKRSESSLFFDKTLVSWKGQHREFRRSGLELLKSIDLSNNNLSGKLPNEITSLIELVSLNVSVNKLHGEVPKDMGRLKSLDSLDLSRNEFSGHIPSSLSQLTFISYLDLSTNNLSGRIPTGPQLQRFNSSSYGGNSQLCGPPLTPRCGLGPPPAPTVDEKEDDESDGDELWKSYYTGILAGFAVGFCGMCGTIFLNRRCRHFLFGSLSHMKDWIYVIVMVQSRKLQRKFIS